MRHTTLTIALTLSLAATPALAWDTCEFTAERKVELDATTALELRTGAGDVEVRGTPGATRVTATARACASSQALLDKLQFVTGSNGGNPLLSTEIPDAEDGWLVSNYAYMDVVVNVPASIALTMRDSSGDATVTGLASVDATDSSGDLTIRDTAGLVRVDDSSGDVNVSRAGSVNVDHDSSGDLNIADIKGDVMVDNDSSGDIEIADVQGNATVRSDSSGGIEFDRIRGTAEVGSDSSGEISGDDIGGDFIVRSDGSGGISHDNVTGRVDIPDND